MATMSNNKTVPPELLNLAALEQVGNFLQLQPRLTLDYLSPMAAVLLDWVLENTTLQETFQEHHRCPARGSLSMAWEQHLMQSLRYSPSGCAYLLNSLEPWLPEVPVR